MGRGSVAAAYGRRAEEYSDLLGSMRATHEDDRRLVAQWARTLSGPVLDVGCGPGHWTQYLWHQGLDVTGVDLAPEMVALARERYPHLTFERADLMDLDVPDGHAAGIFAWYSLIHVDPIRMPAALRELARVTVPGGSLLVGYFLGTSGTPFQHAVTTAYYWSAGSLSRLLADAGFDVLTTTSRPAPRNGPLAALRGRPPAVQGSRPHGAIVARRR